MTRIDVTDFAARVTLASSVTAAVGAVAGAVLGGASALVGVGVGAAVAILNFAWLAHVTAHAAATRRLPLRSRGVALLLIATRYLLIFMALGGPLAAGLAHPLALAVGLTVLPLTLTIQGLRVAREER